MCKLTGYYVKQFPFPLRLEFNLNIFIYQI